MVFTVLAHGGAPGDPAERDGPAAAVEHAREILESGGTALDAACAAVTVLEDDPRFNAGTGSVLRLDGRTIEMDAACMDSTGHYGAVAALRDVKNPVRVARDVVDTPHDLLVGEGATAFAHHRGHARYDPWTEEAEKKYREFMESFRNADPPFSQHGWSADRLEEAWNAHDTWSEVLRAHDTVGAVVNADGVHAAAVSTGGIMWSLPGRVGDSPLLGCGLYAGEAGAVCVTGNGFYILRELVSFRAHERLLAGADPEHAMNRALERFHDGKALGILIVDGTRSAAGATTGMAWARVASDGGRAS